jgi:hypothetical protein
VSEQAPEDEDPGEKLPAGEVEELGEPITSLDRQERTQTHNLREKYANGALIAVAVQIGIADTVFVVYGFANGWNVPAQAMEVWLAATVVQVIGVVLVITRSLFPKDG